MLHTLLPPKERKALRREYRLRASIVLLFALCVAGVVGVVSLFPAFIRSIAEQAAAENQLASIKKEKDQSGLTAIQQQVAIGQKLLTALLQGTGRPALSLLAEELVRERGHVRITSLAVNYAGTTTAAATIQGVAPTRDSLLSFKNSLETDLPGSKVNLPVSELAKSADIAFSVQITISLP